METAEFKRRLDKCKIALFDIDGTCVDGNVSAGIGKSYLKKAYQEGDWSSLAIGTAGGLATVALSDYLGNEQLGLRTFISSLNMTGCADRETSYRFAQRYIEKHRPVDLDVFLNYLKNRGVRCVFFTGGLDVSAKAMRDSVEFGTFFANYTFRENRIVPSRLAETSAFPNRQITKLGTARHFLYENCSGLNECLVVGDAGTDIPLMARAQLSLASPFAIQKVKEAANFWRPSYFEVVLDLSDRSLK